MKSLLAPAALFADGWATDVTIVIGDDGCIRRISRGADDATAERLAGPVIPAMPNLHSHAFQRAIAGRTGTPSPDHDDTFWTWRQAMYAAVNALDPETFEAIAAQAYVEMAKAGYASVAEFHYVHHDPLGQPYTDPAELAWRVVAAAKTAGLGLTLLPVFYAHGNFGNAAPSPLQRRFVHTTQTFEKLYAALVRSEQAQGYLLGVAPHSLRAVSAEELGRVVRLADGAPVHIHAAEQTREVDDCYASTRMRPVEWLLTQAEVDEHWCIVHATHMTDREVTGLAASGAVAGLAPTTEADLGDGIFRGESYLQARGRFGIGTDSNTIIDPFAEVRQLEWSQRLRLRRRNVLVGASQLPVGQTLWQAAVKGGAQALGRPTGAIGAGMRADLIVLDGNDDPVLAGQPLERILDAAIFGPCRRPVRDVMSGGRWIVREGRHPHEEEVLRRFRAALARIDADGSAA